MNISAKEDFNLYCNSEWMKKTNIPKDYTRWGVFEELFELNNKQLFKLIRDINNNKNQCKNSDEEKLKKFWKSATNIDLIEFNKLKDIEFLLNEIDKLENIKNISSLIGFLFINGVKTFINIVDSEDSKKSDIVLAHFYSSGTNLPDRDYYLDKTKKKILYQYTDFLYQLSKLLKINEKDLKKNILKTIQLEKNISTLLYTPEERRLPEKVYNKINIKELYTYGKIFDWKKFIKIINIPDSSEIIVDNIFFYKNIDNILEKYNLNILKLYLKLRTVIVFQPYLNKEFDDLHFNFYGNILRGQKKRKPRDKRVLIWCNNILGELIGKKYISLYFNEESKKKVRSLVNDLLDTFRIRILNLKWMSEKTKKNALKKLQKFNVKIGYPDKWKNYSNLKISEQSLINNILNSYRFEWNNLLKKINKKKNKDEWEMLPHQINAYFHPEMNEIVFPAAILQYPFFDIKSDDATNYGGIGAVIGHEITHGFDDQGRKYDYNGNLKNWWTDKDIYKFKKLADRIEKQFSEKKILNIQVNGKLTLGENIADLGGLTVAFHALQNKLHKHDKLNLQKNNIKFFKSWANIWKSLITDEEQKNRLITDPHAPNSLRINEPLKNMKEFCDTFDVKEGDKMFIKNKIKIW